MTDMKLDIERGSNDQNLDHSSQPHSKSEARTTELLPKPFSTLKAEKVVILSFRSLQLSRIAELQDELLTLNIEGAGGNILPANHSSRVDKALSA